MTPKSVRLTEAQAACIEQAAECGGELVVSTANFHGDAARRQTVQALEAKGIVAYVRTTPRTVKRWAAGTQRPNSRNFAALRQQIAEWRWEADRKTFTSRLERHREELLFEALTALETAEEKARVAELRARLDKPAPAPVPAQQRSAYAEVDPFELCQPEPALPF